MTDPIVAALQTEVERLTGELQAALVRKAQYLRASNNHAWACETAERERDEARAELAALRTSTERNREAVRDLFAMLRSSGLDEALLRRAEKFFVWGEP